MLLPNHDRAEIDTERKLRGYSLNPNHSTGQHKARVFKAALGFGPDQAPILAELIRHAAATQDATFLGENEHGKRYRLEFTVAGLKTTVTIRTGWIVRISKGEDFPRLTTCLVRTT